MLIAETCIVQCEITPQLSVDGKFNVNHYYIAVAILPQFQ